MKLRFEKGNNMASTYYVWNTNDECLGCLVVDKEWKCWIWVQDEVGMSADCLQQVVDKLRELDKNEESKKIHA